MFCSKSEAERLKRLKASTQRIFLVLLLYPNSSLLGFLFHLVPFWNVTSDELYLGCRLNLTRNHMSGTMSSEDAPPQRKELTVTSLITTAPSSWSDAEMKPVFITRRRGKRGWKSSFLSPSHGNSRRTSMWNQSFAFNYFKGTWSDALMPSSLRVGFSHFNHDISIYYHQKGSIIQ